MGEYKYGPAYRPSSFGDEGEKTFVQGFPLFQWANGWPTKNRRIAAGWVSQKGKFGEEFDNAMQVAGYGTFDKVQDNVTNTYWLVEDMDMFVVCLGLDAAKRMEQGSERRGIGYGVHSLGFWPDGRENKDGKLQAVVFPVKLVQAGFVKPCLITARRVTALNIIYALVQHYKVLDWLFEYAKENLKAGEVEPGYPAYYAIAVSIAIGEERSYVGHDGQQSTNIPPTTGIPLTYGEDKKPRFGEDKKAAVTWAQDRLIRRKDKVFAPVLTAIEDELDDAGLSLMDNVLEWSQTFSDRWTKDGDTFKKNTNTQTVARPGTPVAATARNGWNVPVAVNTDDDDTDESLPF